MKKMNYWIPLKKNIIIKKYILDFNALSSGDEGYLHLFEHMLINQNREYFSELEERGVYFNAVTSETSIQFLFFYFKKEISLNFINMINVKFLESNLEVEKKTILEERVWLKKNHTNMEEINTIIGRSQQIKKFDIKKLDNMGQKINRITLITMSNEGPHRNKIPEITINQLNFYEIMVSKIEQKNYNLNTKKIEDKLVLYFIYITKLVLANINLDSREDIIADLVSSDFKKNLKAKKIILAKFELSLSNFKVLENEITEYINKIPMEIINFDSLFLETPWEKLINYE